MKSILLAVVVLMTGATFAQDDSTVSTASNAAIISAGFDNGGFALGADYEHRLHRTHGIGGYARFYQKEEGNLAGTEATQQGITAFGAFVRPHFYRGMWDFSITPGFGIANVDPGTDGDSQFAFGPIFQMDLLAQINRNMAVGMEWFQIYTWMNKEVQNHLKDTVSLRFRFAF